MRIIDIEFQWKEPNFPVETSTVCVVNNAKEYYRISADEDFDARIMYYFMDEDEYQRAFDKDECEFEFTILREVG